MIFFRLAPLPLPFRESPAVGAREQRVPVILWPPKWF
jgi:hypothetical protein